jgi:hypothetical protein
MIVVLGLVASALLIWTIIVQIKLNNKNNKYVATTIEEEYDFIVVGLGAGGSVIASRLSEISHVTVLGVDGGPNELNIENDPSGLDYSFISPHDPL